VIILQERAIRHGISMMKRWRWEMRNNQWRNSDGGGRGGDLETQTFRNNSRQQGHGEARQQLAQPP
jgi:hypothetical protein